MPKFHVRPGATGARTRGGGRGAAVCSAPHSTSPPQRLPARPTPPQRAACPSDTSMGCALARGPLCNPLHPAPARHITPTPPQRAQRTRHVDGPRLLPLLLGQLLLQLGLKVDVGLDRLRDHILLDEQPRVVALETKEGGRKFVSMCVWSVEYVCVECGCWGAAERCRRGGQGRHRVLVGSALRCTAPCRARRTARPAPIPTLHALEPLCGRHSCCRTASSRVAAPLLCCAVLCLSLGRPTSRAATNAACCTPHSSLSLHTSPTTRRPARHPWEATPSPPGPASLASQPLLPPDQT